MAENEALDLRVFADRIAGDFEAFLRELGPVFRTATRDATEVAFRYLCGLVQSDRANMERMEEAVEGVRYQQFQQFISDSPWDDESVRRAVAHRADCLLGGTAHSALLIDESGFEKKGIASAGVARQWNGRLGKTENCQVGVFAVLAAGVRAVPVDAELFLPREWCAAPARCDRAGVPERAREFRSKPELALVMIRRQLDRGIRFRYVVADALYGNSGWLLNELAGCDLPFVMDVHHDAVVFLEDPGIPGDASRCGRTRPRSLNSRGITVAECAAAAGATEWRRLKLRDAENGPVEADFLLRNVWIWQCKWRDRRAFRLLVRREIPEGRLKFSICNAHPEDGIAELASVQGTRHFAERAFQDGKSEVGMADYQVRKWLGWHHHMTMTMLALLFVLRYRVLFAERHPMLSARDIRELLQDLLPRKYAGAEMAVLKIERRHDRRRAAAKRSPPGRSDS